MIHVKTRIVQRGYRVAMDACPKRVSERVTAMRISAIKEMAMRAAGVEDAVSLAWGLPSFRTPEPIRGAVEAALEADPDAGKYALPDGLPELRSLVARRHLQQTGVRIDPDTNVVVTAGNMQGINALLHVLVDPGDEVVVTDPGFASHFQQVRLCGGRTVFWRLDESRGWALDVDALPGLITSRTRAIILVTPSNPTGRIFERAELERVGRIAADANLPIILDDPYSAFSYENRARCWNLAASPGLADHVAYLFTFSKCFAMSGWRLGYMVIPAWLKSEVLKVHDATLICTPRVSQIGGIAALGADPVHLAEFEAVLARRRERICERLDALPQLFEYARPQGAYYVFPRVLAEHADSVQFSLRLLEEAKVCVTPGSAFGPSGEHHVRMAFCVEDDAIERAFDRIEAWHRG